jgi:antitoxin VapB
MIYTGCVWRLKMRIAKLFFNGRSQAVRLPVEFRFEGDAVSIRKDPTTGDVILSARPNSWDDFFQLRDQTEIPDDFMADRGDEPPQKRDLF